MIMANKENRLPTRGENHFPMLQNGRIYYLDRKLEQLATDGRPLSQQNKLTVMYEKRHPIYQALCHRQIQVAENDLQTMIDKITEDYYENIGD